MPRHILAATLIGAGLFGAPSICAAEDGTAVRAAFVKAMEAAERAPQPVAEEARLRPYVLYPYLRAQRLITALEQAPAGDNDEAIATFIDMWPQLAVTPDLRRAWLVDLAEREKWSEVLAQSSDAETDPALVCHRYEARRQLGQDQRVLRDAMTAFWVQAPQMPQACVPPFEWLKEQGQLTPARVELRARKALDDGNLELADWLVRSLPDAAAAPLKQWSRLLRDPGGELDLLAREQTRSVEWPAALSAFRKLAPRDPDRAAAIYRRFVAQRRFEAGQRAELQRWVALGLAWDRRAEAVDWFRTLPDAAMDDGAYEWRVRAALWNRDFTQAARWIQQMPATMRADSRWIYWEARTLELMGQRQQADPLLKTLAQQNGYYSVLASWRLGVAYQPQSRGFADNVQMQSELMSRRGLVRARELFLTEEARWANLEWIAATSGLDDAQRLQAARLASRWGWHVQAVTMLNAIDSLDVFEISYPDPYSVQIQHTAGEVGLPPSWLYGLMRQESLFNPRAVSPSNAYGLLQLLLPTAQEVARKRGKPKPSVDDLLRPEVNIPLGAGYLDQVRQRFDGQFVPAVAAYNAGPNAVARWLPEKPMDADLWVENVPYNQTRGYVQKVLWHIAAHEWRRDGEMQDAAPLLSPIRQPAAN